MSRTNSLWVVIPNWRKFQHYADRRPRWVKAYTALLDDPDYMALSMRRRALLHDLWLAYAMSDGVLAASPVGLSRMLGYDGGGGSKEGRKRVEKIASAGHPAIRMRDLQALSHAGFIEISDSRPTALRYQNDPPELEIERKKVERKKGSPTQRRVKYTGCRYVKGTHSATHVRDVFGTDPPPFGWPYPAPTADEVAAAKATAAQMNGDDDPSSAYPVDDDLLRGMPE